MAKHQPASRQNTMRGTDLPRLRASASPVPLDKGEADQQAYNESKAEIDANLAALRAADKLGETMDFAPFVTDQSPTQIWGAKAAAELQCSFSRWYFMAKANAVIDLFPKQELYDGAGVEARRAMAHKYGTRYAALGPKHSRAPHKDPKLRKQYPSLVEQLTEKF